MKYEKVVSKRTVKDIRYKVKCDQCGIATKLFYNKPTQPWTCEECVQKQIDKAKRAYLELAHKLIGCTVTDVIANNEKIEVITFEDANGAKYRIDIWLGYGDDYEFTDPYVIVDLEEEK